MRALYDAWRRDGATMPSLEEMLPALKGLDDNVTLVEFDLAAHQEEYHAKPRPTGGYLSMTLRKQEHYINNVVFTHPECTWDVR